MLRAILGKFKQTSNPNLYNPIYPLNSMKPKNLKFFAKGKRGVIYTGFYRGKKIAVKKKRPESKAIGRIKNEAEFLKILNKAGIGPKLISFKNNQLIYEFVEGDFILDFIDKSDKRQILKAIKDIFKQMLILDKLNVNKEEMHHPLKHILIDKNNKITLIDFERTHTTPRPKNVTQFCQFLMSIKNLLEKKNIIIDKPKLMELSKAYKNKRTLENFRNILNSLNNNPV